jgi:hypothetical protein
MTRTPMNKSQNRRREEDPEKQMTLNLKKNPKAQKSWEDLWHFGDIDRMEHTMISLLTQNMQTNIGELITGSPTHAEFVEEL